MFHLPKKRPWIIIVVIYIVIIGVWVTFYTLAKKHNGGERMTPEETEQLIKQRNQPQSNADD